MAVPAFAKHISCFYVFNSRNCVLFAKAYGFFRGLRSNSFDSSNNHDTFSWNTKITSCFKTGDIDSARKLFEEMPQRNVVTWNCMISGFGKNHMIDEARHIFNVMPTKNLVSWTAMLSGYIECSKLEEARVLFNQIHNKIKTHVCWDIMLNGYIKFGRVDDARKLFDQCSNPDVGLYKRMLSGYVKEGCVKEAYELFSSMPRHDLASWTCMITCYARAGLINEAKAMVDDIPFEKDAQAWTAIIRSYMQCGMVDEGLKTFHSMANKDIVVWNCVIAGLVENGRLKEALELYGKMSEKNIISSNSILYGFVREGDMINALNFFVNNMILKDTASWNTLISGFSTLEALIWYSRMIRHKFRPDQTTYTTIMSICGALALHSWGKAIHQQIIKASYVHDLLVSSSLISMYSKCGLIDDAETLFRSMDYRDTVTWNTMIVAQAYHGSAGKALELHSCMIQTGCKPNHVTFLALLTACAHWGLVKEGQNHFKSMETEHNITPMPEHYACMIDLFGRSGMLYEAYELLKQLPLHNFPSYGWETLLNYCKLHGNFALGEIVSEKILITNRLSAEMNVLVSNMYAAKGLYDESENIRTEMKERDVKKEVGCSWIELGGSVCKFVYNDKSHPKTEEIYREIENLSVVIKKIGTII
ncbi:pentatricopeptide repeat-containing protein At4g02750-like [Amaranthus tricolor]|uniref:pentatricopeptide repeat-containing protein At4g02750-like n=1 Tax=Amaranthus tricolor TaxID=29722 RepID=UPI0025907754|nr:pentatricopeptide repeat-containing protein At4g02750-like [Amaranthus tricolor]